MPFDGEGIIRAASQLDVAVQLGTAAREVDVPLALGRGAARERIADLLVQTADWSSTAAAELDNAPSALLEVRNGLRNLADQAEAAHASRPWKARAQAGFIDALDGARTTRERIGELVTGAEAIEQGSGRQWILDATGTSTSPQRVNAARDLVRLGEFDDLAPVHPFLERMDPLGRRSLDTAHTAIESGVEPAGRMLVEEFGTIAGTRTAVPTSDIHLALDSVGAADRAPTWLAGAGETMLVDDVHSAAIELAAAGDSPAAVKAQVRSLLERPATELSSPDMYRLAAIGELPDSVAGAINADTRAAAQELAYALRNNQHGAPARLGMWRADAIERAGSAEAVLEEVLGERSGFDAMLRVKALGLDVVSPERPFWKRDFGAQLEQVADDIHADATLDTIRAVRAGITGEQATARAIELARTPDLDAAGARELASLSMLPTEVRPSFLADLTDQLVRSARGEGTEILEDLRWRGDKEWIIANPVAGRAFVEEDIRRNAAMPHHEIGAMQFRRLAHLSELSPELRPILPATRSYSWAEIARYGYGASTFGPELDHLRYTIAAADIAADPAVTAESLRTELRTILAKPDAQIDADVMRRLHVLRQVSGEKSPGLPAAIGYDFDYLARNGWTGTSSYGMPEVDHLRTWLARTDIERDPTTTAETLLEEMRTILAKPDAEIGIEDVRRIAILEGITGEKALHLPAPRNYSFSTLRQQGSSSGSIVTTELKVLRTWLERGDIVRDPSHTAETLRDEVRTILAKPDSSITMDDIGRLSVLEGITGEKSLRLPSPRNYDFTTLLDYGYDMHSGYAPREITNLRMWLERGDIARDPATTADTLLGEVRSILAKPDAEVTTEDIRRIATLEGVTGEKSIHLPEPRSYSFSTIGEYGWSPQESYTTAELRHLRTWLERSDILRDPAATADSLRDEVRGILAKPDAEITAEELRRLGILEGLTGDRALQFPQPRNYTFSTIGEYGWTGSESYVTSELKHLRMWLQRTDIGNDPAITAETMLDDVRAILAKPDAQVTREDVRRLAVFEGITGDKSLRFPDPRSYGFSTIDDYGWGPTESYTTAELKHLRTWLERGDIARDPAITQEMLLDEMRTILAKPDAEITPDELRRIGVLEGVTGDKSLRLPDPRSYNFSTIAEYGWGPTESYTTTELKHLRGWLERGDIARDPAITADSLVDEVRTIVAKPDAEITTDDLRRIGVLEGITGDKALHLPSPRSYSFSTISEYGWRPTDSYAATELANLRSWMQRVDIERDPAITAEALREEAASIALKPPAALTVDDLRRLDVLHTLQGAKAPGIPAPTSYSYEQLAGYGTSTAEGYIGPVREWALVNSPGGLDEVAAQLRGGHVVSPTTMAFLAGHQEELAARGVDIALVLDSGIAALRAKAGAHDQTAELQLVRSFVQNLRVPPELRQLQLETVDMANRNLDRMAGRVHDGYSSYPELGEMGRIIENAELMGRVVSATSSTPAAIADAASDAARAGEQLTW
jgi:hypothetical protein